MDLRLINNIYIYVHLIIKPQKYYENTPLKLKSEQGHQYTSDALKELDIVKQDSRVFNVDSVTPTPNENPAPAAIVVATPRGAKDRLNPQMAIQ